LRAAIQLRQLLDFYFEPFTLQNNRYLLDLISRHVGPPAEAGPWVAEALLAFSCSFEDLSGLGRIPAALTKAGLPSSEPVTAELSQLKHLRHELDGRLCLRTPLEVRSFVAAEGAAPVNVAIVKRYLSAAKEVRAQAPAGLISVTSYSVGAAFNATGAQGHQRQARVKRQLLVHHADLVSLQGCDPDDEGPGASLAATLTEEGYGFACAHGIGGETNSIFWDRSRWEMVGSEESGASLAVMLRPFEDPSTTVRVVCLRPELVGGCCVRGFEGLVNFRAQLQEGDARILACVDLTAFGGAETAAVAQELAALSSVAQEVLGEELAAPFVALSPSSDPEKESAIPLPARGAGGLNKLCRPDAVLYGGLVPIVALSGHTEGYMVTMDPDDVLQQFPAFHLPVVAAFDWRQASVSAPAAVTSAATVADAKGPGAQGTIRI